jgi:FdhD protein
MKRSTTCWRPIDVRVESEPVESEPLGSSPVDEIGFPASSLRPDPTTPRCIVRYRESRGTSVQSEVISEIRFSIFLGGKELVTLMCSPWRLRELVLGFLYIEGLIESPDDVELLRVCLEDRLAEVVLRGEVSVPERKILTSGCTGGQTFGKYLEDIERFRVESLSTAHPSALYDLMRQLYAAAELYRRSGGVHTSVLVDRGRIAVVAEDIGRHNTLDKIQGTCLLQDIETAGRMVLTSGRISSEMLLKSAIMGVAIVGSRTSPTELAITLAEHLNITLVGYIRPGSMNVYAHAWRIAGD